MKYEILINFTDKHNYSIKYVKGDIHSFTDERAEEILKSGKLIKKVVKTPKKSKE